MKVAVTTTEPSLDARVDPRFGRCPYFIVVETEDFSFEALENPNLSLGGGAGIQSAQLMAEKAVQFVLTGNCGPNAHQTLSAAGIEIIVGCSGTVREVVEQFMAGQFNAAGQPNVTSKFGMGGAPGPAPAAGYQQAPPGGGMGMGRGGGRGMGMGRGLGRGRAMGPGAGIIPTGFPTPQSQFQESTQEDKLAQLKQQAEAMSQQMRQIQEQIRQLEKEG